MRIAPLLGLHPWKWTSIRSVVPCDIVLGPLFPNVPYLSPHSFPDLSRNLFYSPPSFYIKAVISSKPTKTLEASLTYLQTSRPGMGDWQIQSRLVSIVIPLGREERDCLPDDFISLDIRLISSWLQTNLHMRKKPTQNLPWFDNQGIYLSFPIYRPFLTAWCITLSLSLNWTPNYC